MKSFKLDAGYSDIDVRKHDGDGFVLTVDFGDCVYLSLDNMKLLVSGLQEMIVSIDTTETKGECHVD